MHDFVDYLIIGSGIYIIYKLVGDRHENINILLIESPTPEPTPKAEQDQKLIKPIDLSEPKPVVIKRKNNLSRDLLIGASAVAANVVLIAGGVTYIKSLGIDRGEYDSYVIMDN